MILDEKQIKKLCKVKRNRDWLDQYGIVLAYRRKYGRFPRTRTEFPPENKVGRWFNDSVRVSYKRGRLKKWQIGLLKKINYVFETPNHWEQNFRALKKGWEDHPESWPYVYYYTPHLKRIEQWCKNQRIKHVEGRLSQRKIEKLNGVRFPWDLPSEVAWMSHYSKAMNWVKEHHCMPQRYSSSANERFCGVWISKERFKSNKGMLSKDRAKKIELLCKTANYYPIRVSWEESYKQYLKWYTEHGKRPRKYAKDIKERRLGSWIVAQNLRLHKGLMTKELAAKLKRLMKSVQFGEMAQT
ncbi:MAG: hypothetical protein A2350_00900 [Candidatus Raymondbacteria bacterium RifOxyB12_full_50_8]|uniref:Helicase-associated domain-containing protein n=1 Tax=Candidatus Raymondbacteria bacterium RIFOXYD12_FULL_49_13 TaxID=1817890 RepID=A0A1F7FJ59_UNCRA|nr:MAG: hypothetical protein A2248_01980 [Candidatus Raymondbacteria bacterium RIFOXYA2_FULL_49_16]OGJ88005.1 MAG: hypothetical protein A2350_00900 [Candidatus Raymondbacteria bacterium RifOxyB12_full_50_8]OGJ95610.1 MAG: hypothetical protein A2453_13050 [Candidatus Raymondbacteria bacterium RIFOXYC2_FULL_50_21]OGK06764.1 MAG: hypothetical protein A2519_05040 [Candidatus Raymondbacteria bacterium RIFOXYD12_FULL_49_13]OGP43208.1 MAG: hypothetical protein A2324_19215 [Candidatus Raymondbacteria b